MNLRRQILFVIDFFRGKKIASDLKNIRYHFNHYFENKGSEERNAALKNLLLHASRTVPFYDKIKENQGLENFPVVNKNIMNEHKEKFISVVYKGKKLHKTTTSGSTGTPFTIFKDQRKINRHRAENIFFTELCGTEIGHVLYYLRVWNNVNKKSVLESFLMNVVPVEISNISDRQLVMMIKKIQQDKRKKSILGFGSTLEELARYVDGKIKKDADKVENMEAIQVMSESISDSAKEALMRYFDCLVLSRYSNMENGFIAHQTPDGGDEYRINHGSFLVEILNLESDTPTGENETGRIVVTDFYNYAMPFIRYDTGDLGSFRFDPEHGMILTNLEGRKVDSIYNTKGELLSPHSITNLMWNYSDIRQFQFIQKSAVDYLVILNTTQPYLKVDMMIADIKYYLGEDALILVEYVDEIPPLLSGKRKKVKNEYIHETK